MRFLSCPTGGAVVTQEMDLLAMIRATLESTTDGILVTNREGRVTDFNRRFAKQWDLDPQSIIGADHRRIIESVAEQIKDPKQAKAEVEGVYSKFPEESFHLLELKDGRFFECVSRTQRVKDQDVGRVWSYRDITERRQSEEVSSRLAAVVESSDDAIVSKTIAGIITSWNKASERIFGYTAEEAIGQSILILIPEGSQSEEADIISRIVKGERVDHFETVRRRKDGTLIHVSLTISPIRDAAGKIIGASKIARDITQRKHFEEQNQELLESERHARKEAERLGHLKDEFLATLSHELRTPLTSILGWAHLIERDPANLDTVSQGIQVILQNTRLQKQLVSDLLDMSGIISGKMRLDVQQVSLPDLIEAVLESIRPTAEAKGVRMETILEPIADTLHGDPARLQQIIWNLASNAVKFTPRGGKIQTVLRRVNSHVEIVVSDTGKGINPQFLPYLFERFRQEDASVTRNYGGLGIGLSLVKQLAEMHGGKVSAASEGEGQGATFTVELPLAVAKVHDSQEKREHPRSGLANPLREGLPNLTGVKVLVVDDESVARDLLARILGDCGAEVVAVASAKEGFQALASESPDVLVSDIGMPEMDGYNFIRKVRASGNRVPAAALTAFARSEDRTKALLAGFQAHIGKPVEPIELLATIVSLSGRTSPFE